METNFGAVGAFDEHLRVLDGLDDVNERIGKPAQPNFVRVRHQLGFRVHLIATVYNESQWLSRCQVIDAVLLALCEIPDAMSQEGERDVVPDLHAWRAEQLNRVANSLAVRSSEDFHRCCVEGQAERFKRVAPIWTTR